MSELNKAGRRLLAYLVGRLPRVVPENPETYVTYKEAHDALALTKRGPTYGVSLKSQGLISLAQWAKDTGRPLITSLIVEDKSRQPGPGFFDFLPADTDRPLQRWTMEIAASRNYDWSDIVDVHPATSNVWPGGPAIWRLITHHQSPQAAFDRMVATNVIAVGWSGVGDLREMQPDDASAITRSLPSAYPDLKNAHLGGPSLWNLYREMKEGDLVIAGGGGARFGVFEVLGDYYYAGAEDILDYRHQRAAVLTAIDPEELWAAVKGAVAQDHNVRWTLALCRGSEIARRVVYREGERYEIRSTAIERSPAARKACLDHYGCACWVCRFDFGAIYGPLGAGYIHVHHRNDLSLSQGAYEIDPVRDLVPLCPNCHAMVHMEKPAMSPEQLKLKMGAMVACGSGK